jgi:membrane-bound serine protease (ClpP class)
VAIIITLLLVGAILMLLETVLPGLVAGTIGLLCLVVAVYLGYADFGVQTGNKILALVVVGLVVGTFAWIKWLPDSRIAARFVSKSQVGSMNNERHDLLHKTGRTVTVLRPSGTALFNDQRVDVVTEGQMVEKGVQVQVVAIEGLRVVVRPQG